MSRRIWIFSLSVVFWIAGSQADTDPLAHIRSLTGQQHFAEALERLEQFLSENPGHLDAKLLRGVVLTRQGDIDAAIAAFAQLSVEHPSLPEPHNNLAVLHASRGDYESARVALLRAIELQPNYDTAHENLGDLYAKLATIQYERALKLNPQNTRAQEKTRVLLETIEHQESDPETVTSPIDGDQTQEPPVVATQDPDDDTSSKACFVIGGLLEEDHAKQVNQWYDEHNYPTRFTSREEDVPIGYRVSIPPLESTAAAEVQITRMRSEGIEDIIRISAGELVNGISLGVYRTEDAARRRMASLETKGYLSKVGTRSRRALVWYVGVVLKANDPSVADFTQRFPDYRIREAGCE